MHHPDDPSGKGEMYPDPDAPKHSREQPSASEAGAQTPHPQIRLFGMRVGKQHRGVQPPGDGEYATAYSDRVDAHFRNEESLQRLTDIYASVIAPVWSDSKRNDRKLGAPCPQPVSPDSGSAYRDIITDSHALSSDLVRADAGASDAMSDYINGITEAEAVLADTAKQAGSPSWREEDYIGHLRNLRPNSPQSGEHSSLLGPTYDSHRVTTFRFFGEQTPYSFEDYQDECERRYDAQAQAESIPQAEHFAAYHLTRNHNGKNLAMLISEFDSYETFQQYLDDLIHQLDQEHCSLQQIQQLLMMKTNAKLHEGLVSDFKACELSEPPPILTRLNTQARRQILDPILGEQTLLGWLGFRDHYLNTLLRILDTPPRVNKVIPFYKPAFTNRTIADLRHIPFRNNLRSTLPKERINREHQSTVVMTDQNNVQARLRALLHFCEALLDRGLDKSWLANYLMEPKAPRNTIYRVLKDEYCANLFKQLLLKCRGEAVDDQHLARYLGLKQLPKMPAEIAMPEPIASLHGV